MAEGEPYFAALVQEGAQLRRCDYAVEAWEGPPAGTIGWWKARVPTRQTKRSQLAPSEVMLDLFVELEQNVERQELRYVLALMLVRRRVLRLEETVVDGEGRELLVLYCARRETTYRARVAVPEASRAAAIQDELARLFSGGAG